MENKDNGTDKAESEKNKEDRTATLQSGKSWVTTATEGEMAPQSWYFTWRAMRERFYPHYVFYPQDPKFWDDDNVYMDDTLPMGYGISYNSLTRIPMNRRESDPQSSSSKSRRRSVYRKSCTYFLIIMGILLLLTATIPVLLHIFLGKEADNLTPEGVIHARFELENLEYVQEMSNSSHPTLTNLKMAVQQEIDELFSNSDVKRYYKDSIITSTRNASSNTQLFLNLHFNPIDRKIPLYRQLIKIFQSLPRDISDNNIGILGNYKVRIDSIDLYDTELIYTRTKPSGKDNSRFLRPFLDKETDWETTTVTTTTRTQNTDNMKELMSIDISPHKKDQRVQKQIIQAVTGNKKVQDSLLNNTKATLFFMSTRSSPMRNGSLFLNHQTDATEKKSYSTDSSKITTEMITTNSMRQSVFLTKVPTVKQHSIKDVLKSRLLGTYRTEKSIQPVSSSVLFLTTSSFITFDNFSNKVTEVTEKFKRSTESEMHNPVTSPFPPETLHDTTQNPVSFPDRQPVTQVERNDNGDESFPAGDTSLIKRHKARHLSTKNSVALNTVVTEQSPKEGIEQAIHSIYGIKRFVNKENYTTSNKNAPVAVKPNMFVTPNRQKGFENEDEVVNTMNAGNNVVNSSILASINLTWQPDQSTLGTTSSIKSRLIKNTKRFFAQSAHPQTPSLPTGITTEPESTVSDNKSFSHSERNSFPVSPSVGGSNDAYILFPNTNAINVTDKATVRIDDFFRFSSIKSEQVLSDIENNRTNVTSIFTVPYYNTSPINSPNFTTMKRNPSLDDIHNLSPYTNTVKDINTSGTLNEFDSEPATTAEADEKIFLPNVENKTVVFFKSQLESINDTYDSLEDRINSNKIHVTIYTVGVKASTSEPIKVPLTSLTTKGNTSSLHTIDTVAARVPYQPEFSASQPPTTVEISSIAPNFVLPTTELSGQSKGEISHISSAMTKKFEIPKQIHANKKEFATRFGATVSVDKNRTNVRQMTPIDSKTETKFPVTVIPYKDTNTERHDKKTSQRYKTGVNTNNRESYANGTIFSSILITSNMALPLQTTKRTTKKHTELSIHSKQATTPMENTDTTGSNLQDWHVSSPLEKFATINSGKTNEGDNVAHAEKITPVKEYTDKRAAAITRISKNEHINSTEIGDRNGGQDLRVSISVDKRTDMSHLTRNDEAEPTRLNKTVGAIPFIARTRQRNVNTDFVLNTSSRERTPPRNENKSANKINDDALHAFSKVKRNYDKDLVTNSSIRGNSDIASNRITNYFQTTEYNRKRNVAIPKIKTRKTNEDVGLEASRSVTENTDIISYKRNGNAIAATTIQSRKTVTSNSPVNVESISATRLQATGSFDIISDERSETTVEDTITKSNEDTNISKSGNIRINVSRNSVLSNLVKGNNVTSPFTNANVVKMLNTMTREVYEIATTVYQTNAMSLDNTTVNAITVTGIASDNVANNSTQFKRTIPTTSTRDTSPNITLLGVLFPNKAAEKSAERKAEPSYSVTTYSLLHNDTKLPLNQSAILASHPAYKNNLILSLESKQSSTTHKLLTKAVEASINETLSHVTSTVSPETTLYRPMIKKFWNLNLGNQYETKSTTDKSEYVTANYVISVLNATERLQKGSGKDFTTISLKWHRQVNNSSHATSDLKPLSRSEENDEITEPSTVKDIRITTTYTSPTATKYKPDIKYLWGVGLDLLSGLYNKGEVMKQPDSKWTAGDFVKRLPSNSTRLTIVNKDFKVVKGESLQPKKTLVIRNDNSPVSFSDLQNLDHNIVHRGPQEKRGIMRSDKAGPLVLKETNDIRDNIVFRGSQEKQGIRRPENAILLLLKETNAIRASELGRKNVTAKEMNNSLNIRKPFARVVVSKKRLLNKTRSTHKPNTYMTQSRNSNIIDKSVVDLSNEL